MSEKLNGAYEKIYIALKNRIVDKVYVADMEFPLPKALEEEFEADEGTIKKAIAALTDEGYLARDASGAHKVRDIAATQRLNTITSMTETLTSKGYKVTTHDMMIKKEVAPANIARALKLDNGSLVYKIQRLQCADGHPVAIVTNYLLPRHVPNLEECIDEFVSLYAFLEDQYGIVFEEAFEYVTAVETSFEESLILKVPVGAPLLRSRRITYTNDKKAFGYDIVKLVPDKYEYCIHLEGRSRGK